MWLFGREFLERGENQRDQGKGDASLNVATIKWLDIANGPGIRISLFVSGCRHHCQGCFNPETWDFDYGTIYTKETQECILDGLEKQYVCGLTLLGGEPFEPENQAELLELTNSVRQKYPEKSIWCYTGYTLEQDILSGKLGKPEVSMALLRNLDVLVDGEFHIEEKNPSLRFRGSENQRIIDVQESLKDGKTILWDGREEP